MKVQRIKETVLNVLMMVAIGGWYVLVGGLLVVMVLVCAGG